MQDKKINAIKSALIENGNVIKNNKVYRSGTNEELVHLTQYLHRSIEKYSEIEVTI